MFIILTIFLIQSISGIQSDSKFYSRHPWSIPTHEKLKPKPIPYKLGDLEPIISERLMKIHYKKIYTGFAHDYNKALKNAIRMKPHITEVFANGNDA